MFTVHSWLQNSAIPEAFFAQCNSFLQIIPPSLKTNSPQKRKPVLTRSTLGRSLQTFCSQASCVSCW